MAVLSPCTNASGVQFSLRAVCADGLPIHARSRRFSPGSPVSSCFQILECCIVYVCIVICLNVELLALIKLLPTNCIVSV